MQTINCRSNPIVSPHTAPSMSKRRILRNMVCTGLAAAMLAAFAPASASAANYSWAISTKQSLNDVLPATRMRNVSLRQAIAYLRNTTEANIFVNWNALQNAGVSPNTPINLELRDVAVHKILSIILQQVSPQTTLVYFVSDNVLTITTRSDANLHMVTRVYPVDDLVMTVPNFTNAPTFNLQSATQNSTAQVSASGGGGLGSAGGQDLFQGNNTMAQSAAQTSSTRRGKQLVRLIEETIHPNIWVHGGGQANIMYFNRSLVVTAPVYIQELVGGR